MAAAGAGRQEGEGWRAAPALSPVRRANSRSPGSRGRNAPGPAAERRGETSPSARLTLRPSDARRGLLPAPAPDPPSRLGPPLPAVASAPSRPRLGPPSAAVPRTRRPQSPPPPGGFETPPLPTAVWGHPEWRRRILARLEVRGHEGRDSL